MAGTEAEVVRHLADVSSTSAEAVNRWIEGSEEVRKVFEDYTRCRETARECRASLCQDQRRAEEFEELPPPRRSA